MADGGHIEFWALTNSAHTFMRVTPAKCLISIHRRQIALCSPCMVTEVLQITQLVKRMCKKALAAILDFG